MGANSTMLFEQGRAACLPVAICSFSKPMCIGYRAHGALLQVCVGVLVGAPHGREFHPSRSLLGFEQRAHHLFGKHRRNRSN